jgi:hypothetical protein
LEAQVESHARHREAQEYVAKKTADSQATFSERLGGSPDIDQYTCDTGEYASRQSSMVVVVQLPLGKKGRAFLLFSPRALMQAWGKKRIKCRPFSP